MRPIEYLFIAIRAIRANPLRSVLTTLGVIIGVGSVVTLVSLGQGAGKQISQQIQGLGANTIVVSTQIPPNGGTSNPNNQGGPPQLFPSDAKALRDGLPNATVVPDQSAQATVKLGTGKVAAQVVGTWSTWATARKLRLSTGTFLTPAADKNPLSVAVLGSSVAYDLFGRLDPVGRYVTINDYRYQVLGVVAPTGYQNFQNVDSFVYVPFLMTQKQILNTDVVNHLYVYANSPAQVPALEPQIVKIMSTEHGGITDPAQFDFNVRSQTQILSLASGTLSTITTLLSSIAAISLVVGGIGIMNIMLVSVTERTREIGIRLALGAVPREIVAQFIAEAIVLSSLGGLLGVLLGIAASKIISATAGWQTAVSAPVILIAFVFSLLVGVFFGWFPAFKASRLDPIQALRYE